MTAAADDPTLTWPLPTTIAQPRSPQGPHPWPGADDCQHRRQLEAGGVRWRCNRPADHEPPHRHRHATIHGAWTLEWTDPS